MGADLTRRGVADLVGFMEAAKLTPEEVDDVLTVAPGTVRTWRDGGVPIPKEKAEDLALYRACAEYESRVADMELPACAAKEALWKQVEAFPIEGSPSRESKRAFADYQTHLKQCPVCRPNEERIERELGKHPLLRDRVGRDFRITLALYRWAERPWTLVLTLPWTVGSGFLAFRTPGNGPAEMLRWMYLFLAMFGLRLILPALATIWDRLRHGTHD